MNCMISGSHCGTDEGSRRSSSTAWPWEWNHYTPPKLWQLLTVLYAFFWVIPRRLNFIFRRFGTLCLFHLHRHRHLPAYKDGTDSFPKRRHIKFRRRGITQKKAYNIQNRAKVWNQENSLPVNMVFILQNTLILIEINSFIHSKFTALWVLRTIILIISLGSHFLHSYSLGSWGRGRIRKYDIIVAVLSQCMAQLK